MPNIVSLVTNTTLHAKIKKIKSNVSLVKKLTITKKNWLN